MNWSAEGRRPSNRLRQCFAALAAVGLNLLFLSLLTMHREGVPVLSKVPQGILYLMLVPPPDKLPQVTPKVLPLEHSSKVVKPNLNRSSSPAAVYVVPSDVKSQATPPAAEPLQPEGADHHQAPATLDLSDGALRRAAQAARKGGIGGLADAAGVPLDAASGPTQGLTEDVKRSARLDCRTAHAGKGLLAVPFLLADTITDKGCRW